VGEFLAESNALCGLNVHHSEITPPSSDGKVAQLDKTLRLLHETGITRVKIIGDTETLDVELEQDGRCRMQPYGHSFSGLCRDICLSGMRDKHVSRLYPFMPTASLGLIGHFLSLLCGH
jgi:hypothetical protein